jgi:hypothetical protein
MKKLFLLISLLTLSFDLSGQSYTLSGHIYDAEDEEALAGAAIYIPSLEQGVATNVYGFYSLTLKQPVIELRISYLGYESINITLDLRTTQNRDFYLKKQVQNLGEDIVVTAERFELREEVNSTSMGKVTIKPREINIIPTIGGEADLIKVAQLTPGVTSGNEGTIGFFVRGGTDDQNLVMLDEAAVYNVGHLFGFFSVFNTDALKDIDLVKGAFPARYGGRLSSIMDIRMKEGSLQKYNLNGGVGLLTSRFTADGPIVKDKASFMISGRRTYIDQVFGLAGVNLPYYFYDLNAKINVRLSERDRLYFSSYFGDDVLSLNSTTSDSTDDGEEVTEDLGFGFRLGNFTSSLRWNHVYDNDKLFSNVTFHQTRFSYDIEGDFIDNSLLIRSNIQDIGLAGDWQYFQSVGNQYSFGTQFIYHIFRPNVTNTSGDISEFLESNPSERIPTTEFAIYASNERELGSRLKIDAGFRLSFSTTDDTLYWGPEPRLAFRYKINDRNSFKGSYSLMRQYIHRVSSSSIALPTDLWYPVTRTVLPQRSDLFAAGYTHILPKLNLSISLEGYYKSMDNLIEYREGANLILNDNFENELLNGSGESYGIEMMMRKQSGRLSGWFSYTLSRSTRLFDELNSGREFPAKYDRRHVFNLVGMLDLNDKITFSAVWTYFSGARFTPQTGQFLMPNSSLTDVELVPIFGDRNSALLAASHRLDLNFVIRNSERKKFRSEWQIGAYNFYSRAAPFRVVIDSNGRTLQYEQEGLFGFIPSISYNFSFDSSK